jgi:hypothetical protein
MRGLSTMTYKPQWRFGVCRNEVAFSHCRDEAAPVKGKRPRRCGTVRKRYGSRSSPAGGNFEGRLLVKGM